MRKTKASDLKKGLNALEARECKAEIMESIKELSETIPNIQQKLAIMQTWFVAKTDRGNPHELLTVREAGEIILSKGLANDIDSAIKIVQSQLKLSAELGD